MSRRHRRVHYRIHVPNLVVPGPKTKIGSFSVLDMPRVRGTATDWFRHTLYDYS